MRSRAAPAAHSGSAGGAVAPAQLPCTPRAENHLAGIVLPKSRAHLWDRAPLSEPLRISTKVCALSSSPLLLWVRARKAFKSFEWCARLVFSSGTCLLPESCPVAANAPRSDVC